MKAIFTPRKNAGIAFMNERFISVHKKQLTKGLLALMAFVPAMAWGQIQDPCVIQINAGVTTGSICNGSVKTLTLEAKPGTTWTNIKWQMKVPGGQFTDISGATNLSYNANQTGVTYRVMAKNDADCNGNKQSNEFTLTVNPLPVVSITDAVNGQICNGSSATLTANVTTTTTAPYTYSWNGGNYGTSATFSANTGNNNTLTVKDGNGCVSNSANKQLTVNPNPVVSITDAVNGQICDGSSATLSANVTTATTAPYTYSWNNGQYGTSSTLSVNTGANNTLTVKDAKGCVSDTANKQLTVNANPTVVITGAPAAPICATNTAVNLTTTVVTLATTGTTMYSWNGQTAVVTDNLDVDASTSGTKTTTVKVTDGNGCTSTTATKAFDVNANPVVTLAVTTMSICADETVAPSFDATTTVDGVDKTATATYSWTNSGASVVGTNASFATLVGGTYKVIATYNGCSSQEQTATLTVKDNPVVTLSATTKSICADETIAPSFDATTTVDGVDKTATATYSWTNSGASVVGTNASFATLVGGTYKVIATYNGCSSQEQTATLTVKDNPVITALATNQAICDGQTYTYSTTTTVGGVDKTADASYAWDVTNYTPASFTNATDANKLTTGANGTHTVKAMYDGCYSQEESATLTVKDNPAASITTNAINGQICNGSSATLTANLTTPTTAPYTYSWNNGNYGTLSTCTANTGNNTLKVKDANGCVSKIANTQINVNNSMTVTITGQTKFCKGGTVNLTAIPAGGSGNYTYSWSGNANAGQQTPSIHTTVNANSATVTYTVIVTDSKGCTGTASQVLTKVTNCSQVSRMMEQEAEESTATFKIFPNPSTGLVNITLGNDEAATKVIVTDIQGRQVFQKDFGTAYGQVQVDLTSLKSGMYIMYVENGDAKHVTKISIQ